MTRDQVSKALSLIQHIKALAEIVNVRGENTCKACKCEGCLWEMGEAARLAKAILGPQDAKQGANPPETPVERATGDGSAGDSREKAG